MKTNWIEIKDQELPDPNRLTFFKVKNGGFYIGRRTKQRWEGAPLFNTPFFEKHLPLWWHFEDKDVFHWTYPNLEMFK